MHGECVRNGYCCQLDRGNNIWLLKSNKDVKHLVPESVSGEDDNNNDDGRWWIMVLMSMAVGFPILFGGCHLTSPR